jgi:hypothetical protein
MKQFLAFISIFFLLVSQGMADVSAEEVLTTNHFRLQDGFNVIHSNGFVFIYTPGTGQTTSPVRISVITEAEIIDAAVGNNQTVGAEDLPRTLNLAPAYPNPFNPNTTIEFALDQTEAVTLSIHNMQGQEVGALIDGLKETGKHRIDFDGAGLASGVYSYTLQVGSFSQTKTFTLLK